MCCVVCVVCVCVCVCVCVVCLCVCESDVCRHLPKGLHNQGESVYLHVSNT